MTRPARAYQPDRLAVLRAALARGPLVKTPGRPSYSFGVRTFGCALVAQLVDAGEAMQLADGRVIVTAKAAQAGSDA